VCERERKRYRKKEMTKEKKRKREKESWPTKLIFLEDLNCLRSEKVIITNRGSGCIFTKIS
jgi:hypothetical protein